MPMCTVKNLIKMPWTIQYIDKNEKYYLLHSTHNPGCSSIEFYWLKVKDLFKNKIYP